MTRFGDVTLTDLLVWELDHPRCHGCDALTCRAVACTCGLPHWVAHRLTCGVELGVAG